MKRNINIWIVILSVVIPVVVAILIFKPAQGEEVSPWVYQLPALNAIINSVTAILLFAGLIMIRQKKIRQHRNLMVVSFILGTLFLVFYVMYHSLADSTSFGGEGIIRTVYYILLISHILLAAVVVPLVLFAFYFALTDKIDRHKKIVKYTWPIWFYVSVSGVLVYLMISPYYG